ncbi:unnamed protein product [Tuber aestivum]|uniref:F-box domain-containing protein n=1 Tax=Tuber aestivum TaxID=59557 RepID=A0A292Q0V3_9PEZI|nr:unnamed protein product [Tuber aestivum]
MNLSWDSASGEAPTSFAFTIDLEKRAPWKRYLRSMHIAGIFEWNQTRYWAVTKIGRELAECTSVSEFRWLCMEGPPPALLDAVLAFGNIRALELVSFYHGDPPLDAFSTVSSLDYLLEMMRENDYPRLRELRLAPIYSEDSLQNLGETISRLSLDKLVVVGRTVEIFPLLKLKSLVECAKIGSDQPWDQCYVGFDFKDTLTSPGTLLSAGNLRSLVLQDCTNINEVLSRLGERSESLRILDSLNIEYGRRMQHDNPIRAIETANYPAGGRVEVEAGRADCEIHLIDACRSLVRLELDLSFFSVLEVLRMLDAIENSRETLKYLRLNVSRNLHWLRIGLTGLTMNSRFFEMRYIDQLSTFRNLRQLSICLCFSPKKISRVCSALPPGLELLELSYWNIEHSSGLVARELMLMTYALKRRAVDSTAGRLPLKCIVLTELGVCSGDGLDVRVWVVDEGSGRFFLYDEGMLDLDIGGQNFFEFAKIELGITPDAW